MSNPGVEIPPLSLANPFLIASGPPGTNANVIARALREGWGGVVSKTVLLDASRIVNVAPRYARLRFGEDIVGWENIELITDRPLGVWLDEFRRLRDDFPGKTIIASIMEEPSRDAWHEIVERVQATGVDALELNLSCPHGLPEQRMGAAIGQDAELVGRVCGWAMEAARVPVWAKLTPNVTDIRLAADAALGAGCQGVSAINTILSIMGVNLDTLAPEPAVEGHSTPGGYSGQAIRPIALRMVAETAALIRDRYPGRSLSAIGGVERAEHAIEHLLLGATTVQVCTGVMIHGYGLIHDLRRGLDAFMQRHGFSTIDDFRGRALARLTTHADLVRRQAQARAAAASSLREVKPLSSDTQWRAESIVEQSRGLADETLSDSGERHG